MRARIQKWGNSLALRIPKPFAAEAGLAHQTEVDVSVVDGALVVKPRLEPPVSLEDLLAQVTDENLHDEIKTGPSVGREIW